jgi:Helix-turn-helix domain
MATSTKRRTVLLTTAQRQELESLLRRTTLAAGLARRARAILLLSQGHSISAVGRLVAMQRRHIYKWMDRFREQGIAGLSDEKRTGRPPVFSPRGRDASGQDRLRAAR